MLTLFPLTTWAAFLYAGSHTNRRDLKLAAGFYGGLLLVSLLVSVAQGGEDLSTHTSYQTNFYGNDGGTLSNIGGTILAVAWIVGMIHAFLIRPTVNRQLALVNDPVLKKAQKEIDRREYGRQLLRTNPTLARQVGVGRPDIAGSNSFGLIDVNHAGRKGLLMLPGLTKKHVDMVLEYRENGGSFISVDDLALYLDLPVAAIDQMRETAAFGVG